MCGIVGYVGAEKAQDVLLDGLSRLEYRGYDSSGIAVLAEGKTVVKRSEGKLAKLRALLSNNSMPSSHVGIGHTRWATHGRPSETNAHPHHYGSITVVHNGIIENYAELQESLKKKGHRFSSETDSEILAHLVQEELGPRTSTLEALKKALKKVQGSYALAMLNEGEADCLYAARNGSPLVVGYGKEEKFLASDVPALLPYTKRVVFLEDGELAQLKKDQVQITDLQGKQVQRSPKLITWDLAVAEKSGYKHFMLKEIFEQPRALTDTLRGHLQIAKKGAFLAELEALFPTAKSFGKINKIYVVACGTSWHAALTARYFLEPAAVVPVQVDLASEFRYRDPLIDRNTLTIAISQSGETADTLVAVKNAKAKGSKILAITNVVDSSLARESHGVLYTHAGPEIGVAATKTFTAQVAALQLLGVWLGKKSGGLKADDAEDIVQELLQVPSKVEQVLKGVEQIREIALKYADKDQYLFIGRGPQFPIALEGALKLKEISYLHAEGFSAGELKHGPIALIDRGSPVVALALQDHYYEKMLSNIQEVLSRQAEVIAVVTEGDMRIRKLVHDVIEVPAALPAVTPILTVVPLQLFAYFIADHKGHDVDQPRNLAKSVTVE
jgi:glucosamine--fructose-6-phosphate aminotransferase (isomerizing)